MCELRGPRATTPRTTPRDTDQPSQMPCAPDRSAARTTARGHHHGRQRALGPEPGRNARGRATPTAWAACARPWSAATEIGVKYLTLYAFSTENWNRPQAEVDALMDLLVNTLMSEMESLHENGVRLNTIGDTDSLPRHLPRHPGQGHPTDRPQRPHHPHPRAQLQRPLGDAACRALHRTGRQGRSHRHARGERGALLRPPQHRTACPTPNCSSAPAASSASATSCSGRSPMPSSGSPRALARFPQGAPLPGRPRFPDPRAPFRSHQRTSHQRLMRHRPAFPRAVDRLPRPGAAAGRAGARLQASPRNTPSAASPSPVALPAMPMP